MKTLKHIVIILLVLVAGFNSVARDSFKVIPVYKTEEYKTGQKHTLSVQVQNSENEAIDIEADIKLPEGWDLITQGTVGTLQAMENKVILLSFYIPANTSPGITSGIFLIKDKDGSILQSDSLAFNIAVNHKLDVTTIYTPQFIQAGERIDTRFEVKNSGNVTEEITLSSRNNIQGELIRTLTPDSSVIITVTEETNPKNYFIYSVSSNLEVLSTLSEEYFRAYGTTKVFPVKMEEKDAFYRFPVQASIYYNGYNNKNEHFSSMSFEVQGNGYLDLNKNHYLNFMVKGPNQIKLRRFGMNDQYSLIYKYKNQTTLHLGDHTYYINRLGFNGRYGMGFRLDQEVNDWTLSAFYTKPRLYTYYKNPMFGVKAVYNITDSLSIGASVVRSKENEGIYNQNINSSPDEVGQVFVLEVNYLNKNTRIQAELSESYTNEHIDYAGYINFSQRIGRFRYSGNATVAGKNYFGTLSNSLRFGNNLMYDINKWNISVGQGYSRINERQDTLFYSPEPSFKNYYASLRYRFNSYHSANIRVDHRTREDRQRGERKFYYEENGIDYFYRFTSKPLTASFNGRVAQTQNLLTAGSDTRTTYGHYLNTNYRLHKKLSLRGSLSHNYTNRYGNSDINTNYFRYGFGFNYNLSQKFRVNLNYNSGFSPEETYQQREFINAGIYTRINKNHLFELRANYYSNPGVDNKKELYTHAKYTYTIGAPLKKVLKQGSVSGRIVTHNPDINVKGIQIIATGNEVRTDSRGKFELNNLPLGTNFIIIEQASLPKNMVAMVKIPFQIDVFENREVPVNIELVKAGGVNGKLVIAKAENNDKGYNLEGYFKLENQNFTYYVESDKNGIFNFEHIVPGNYKLTLLKLKDEDKLTNNQEFTSVIINEGEAASLEIVLKEKERKVKFEGNNFKIEE
jgi:hypothetical protein